MFLDFELFARWGQTIFCALHRLNMKYRQRIECGLLRVMKYIMYVFSKKWLMFPLLSLEPDSLAA